jgi:uncharacterized protein YndB with AHSA1/START domain
MQARASIVIGCDPSTAFDFVADAANDRAWRSHLVSSRGRASTVGDRVTQTYSAEGKTAAIELEVVEFERPERLGYTMSKPARARFSFQFRPEGSGTRVSMSISANLTGPAALFEGRVQSEADKVLKADLEKLRRVLEAGRA